MARNPYVSPRIRRLASALDQATGQTCAPNGGQNAGGLCGTGSSAESGICGRGNNAASGTCSDGANATGGHCSPGLNAEGGTCTNVGANPASIG